MKAGLSNSIYQLYSGKSQSGTSSSLLRLSTLKSSPCEFSNTPGQCVKMAMSQMHSTHPMLNANAVYCNFYGCFVAVSLGLIRPRHPPARRGSHLSPANRRSQGRRGG